MTTATPELKIEPKLPVLAFNFDQLKAWATALAERYAAIVVTEDAIADVKRDMAELNKAKKAVDDALDGEGVDFDAMADADGAENKVPADVAADAEIDAPGCTSCGHRDSGDDRGNYTPLDQPAQQGTTATAGGAQ